MEQPFYGWIIVTSKHFSNDILGYINTTVSNDIKYDETDQKDTWNISIWRAWRSIYLQRSSHGPSRNQGCPIRIIIKCQKWTPHASDGYYLGPAMKHYHCWRVIESTTVMERIRDMVKLYHHYQKPPTMTPSDEMESSMDKIIKIIRIKPVIP